MTVGAQEGKTLLSNQEDWIHTTQAREGCLNLNMQKFLCCSPQTKGGQAKEMQMLRQGRNPQV